MPSSALPWYLKGILYVALPAACVAALYLSIPGEVALARTAGWSEHYAPAMPVCLSVYALSAGAIATYRRKMELPGQVTALLGSLMALLLAMSAQSISHLIEASYMESSPLLVVAVSCVPPLTIAHLVHMAETPSQVRSASEELDELRDLTANLMTALVVSESRALVSHSANVVREMDYVKALAGELTEEAEGLSEEIEKSLSARKSRKALTVTSDEIEEARKRLAATSKGGKVTVEGVCQALGISQASYYRYYQPQGA